MKLKSYVINLDCRTDRLFRFYQQSGSHLFQRFPAIDRQTVERVGLENVFDIATAAARAKRPITSGEVACCLSHIGCFRLIANDQSLQESDFALIAEDDVQLVAHFEHHLQRVLTIIADYPQFECVLLQKLNLYADGSVEAVEHLNQPINVIFSDMPDLFICNGASLYLVRKSLALRMMAILGKEKPSWLADDFEQFCSVENMALTIPLLGTVPANNQDSDLEADRQIMRQWATSDLAF